MYLALKSADVMTLGPGYVLQWYLGPDSDESAIKYGISIRMLVLYGPGFVHQDGRN